MKRGRDEIPKKGGSEWDCFSGWRKAMGGGAGKWGWVKNKYVRRIRQKVKKDLREGQEW